MFTENMTTLTQVKEVQPQWFSKENKRFFNDVSYRVMIGKQSHSPYLVRYTAAWSDMFGQPKRFHYCINHLDPETLKIGHLIEKDNMTIQFMDIDAVKDWLREN